MLKKIDIGKIETQYFIGLLINLAFLAILYSFDTSYINIQIPKGSYQDNIWQCSDVISYVDPALNFLEYGVFGHFNKPDHFRTIGYPAIISFFYYFFGHYWLLALQIFQAIIFAFIYPLVSSTIKLIFPNHNQGFEKAVFIFLCFSGSYFTRTAGVLSDTLFTLLFISGFYFGLKTYITKRYKDLILYLFLMTIAALVRPTLTLLPLLNLVIGYYVATKYNSSVNKTFIKSLCVSFVILVLTNISTIRNYCNYSFGSQSSVIGINAFHYLAKKILEKENKSDEYALLKQKIDSIDYISIQTKMRTEIMYKTVLKYPFTTIKILGTNTINVFVGDNLLSNISPYFGYQWKLFKGSCLTLKTNKILYYSAYILMFLYAVLWSLFLLKLIYLLRMKDYSKFYLVTMLFIMFIIPAILTGDGGGRFRLPFEHILFIFGISTFFKEIGKQQQLPLSGGDVRA